jgi:hypothetical protein
MKISLHGSLAATGMGHMTPHAVLLGLMGCDPENVEVGRLGRVWDEVRGVGEIELGLDGLGASGKRVKFDLDKDLVSEHIAFGLFDLAYYRAICILTVISPIPYPSWLSSASKHRHGI